MTPIAAPADAHLRGTARAAVEPIRRLARLHRASAVPLDNAAQSRHKGKARTPSSARALEGPGFCPGICPGLRLCGVCHQHNARNCRRPKQSVIAQPAPQPTGPVSAAQRRSSMPVQHEPRKPKIPKTPLRHSGGVPRLSPKSRGFRTPSTLAQLPQFEGVIFGRSSG
jgi:hypothetical protein